MTTRGAQRLAQDGKAFAQAVVTTLLARVTSGSMPPSDWMRYEPARSDLSDANVVTHWTADVGSVRVDLRRATDTTTHYGYVIRVYGGANGDVPLGASTSDDEASPVGQLVAAVDRAVTAQVEEARVAAIREMGLDD